VYKLRRPVGMTVQSVVGYLLAVLVLFLAIVFGFIIIIVVKSRKCLTVLFNGCKLYLRRQRGIRK